MSPLQVHCLCPWSPCSAGPVTGAALSRRASDKLQADRVGRPPLASRGADCPPPYLMGEKGVGREGAEATKSLSLRTRLYVA